MSLNNLIVFRLRCCPVDLEVQDTFCNHKKLGLNPAQDFCFSQSKDFLHKLVIILVRAAMLL